MIIYFAGWANSESSLSPEINDKVNYILLSYYYNQKVQIFEEYSKLGKKVFLDSGAYSAYTQNVEINLDEYCNFIKSIQDYLETYVVLDDIRGAKQTFENQKKMEDKGLKPIPCFHYGEKMKLLEYYAKRHDYIALGGLMKAKGNRKLLDSWLEEIFEKYPEHKFHGFGLTSFKLLRKFRWYSVDSTTWGQGGRFGRIQLLDGTYLYFIDNTLHDYDSPLIYDKVTKILKSYDTNYSIEKFFESSKLRNDFSVLTFFKLMEDLTTNPPDKFKSNQYKLF